MSRSLDISLMLYPGLRKGCCCCMNSSSRDFNNSICWLLIYSLVPLLLFLFFQKKSRKLKNLFFFIPAVCFWPLLQIIYLLFSNCNNSQTHQSFDQLTACCFTDHFIEGKREELFQ